MFEQCVVSIKENVLYISNKTFMCIMYVNINLDNERLSSLLHGINRWEMKNALESYLHNLLQQINSLDNYDCISNDNSFNKLIFIL